MNIYHTCKNSQQRPGRREDCHNCNPGKRADKSNEIIVRQAARIAALEKSLRFYAAEAHIASGDAMHNRLHFDDCDHPDCIKARNLAGGAS